MYRGADDRVYCNQENHTPCGRGDGVGFLEPDKIGELGYAYLLFYEVTLEDKYLQAALRCADALAKHAAKALAASTRTCWARSAASPSSRMDSCGEWIPMPLFAEMKSQRNCARRRSVRTSRRSSPISTPT